MGSVTGIGHYPNASLGTQLVRLQGAPFCAVCYLGKTSLPLSKWTSGGSGTRSIYYRLDLTNAVPIRAKPPRLRPEEEAWLDVHLDELVAKGVIGPILPGE